MADLRQTWTLNAMADHEGFAVLYPQALAGQWAYADSRPVPLPDGGLVDDLGFIGALLDHLAADRAIDPAHVYAAACRTAASWPVISAQILASHILTMSLCIDLL